MADSTSNAIYSYSSLPNNHFRVLELVSLEPTIAVNLIDCPEDNLPGYVALSYSWGIESASESISCSGGRFVITPHLKEGLRCVFSTQNCRRLWVDAICINQNDAIEKAAQVSSMHHIYRKAKSVCVWLGKEENGSDQAIAAIKRVPEEEKDDMDISARLLGLRSTAPHLFDESIFKPLAHLSRRSWFRRLWIAQEFFYAKSAEFLCGTSVLASEKLIDILGRLSIHSFGVAETQEFREEPQLFVGFQAMLSLDKIKKSHAKGDKLSFFDFVLLGRERFAKEPVDRVYAAFGMAEGIDEVYRNEIKIDYSDQAKSHYWELYSVFGKIALTHEADLRLLSVVSSRERPESLPSWCPNLNSPPITAELDEIKVYSAGWPFEDHAAKEQANLQAGADSCSRHQNFKGREANHVHLTASSNTILIWGASVGEVSGVSRPLNWDPDINTEDIASAKDFAKGVLEWLASTEKFFRDHVEDSTNAAYIWSEVLVGATDEKRRNKARGSQDQDAIGSPQQNTEEQIDRKENSAYTLLKSVFYRIYCWNPEDGPQQDPELVRHFEMVHTWILFIHQDWSNRVAFATDSGRFGFASENVQKGDLACMLYGGRCMYILRKREAPSSDFEFIGDAFVLDCMNGQCFELLDEGIIKQRLFAIS